MNKKVESVLKKIKKYNEQLRMLQSTCPHENVKACYDASTGNFDPSDDNYWLIVSCKDCEHQMCFDYIKDSENYQKFSKFVKQ